MISIDVKHYIFTSAVTRLTAPQSYILNDDFLKGQDMTQGTKTRIECGHKVKIRMTATHRFHHWTFTVDEEYEVQYWHETFRYVSPVRRRVYLIPQNVAQIIHIF